MTVLDVATDFGCGVAENTVQMVSGDFFCILSSMSNLYTNLCGRFFQLNRLFTLKRRAYKKLDLVRSYLCKVDCGRFLLLVRLTTSEYSEYFFNLDNVGKVNQDIRTVYLK